MGFLLSHNYLSEPLINPNPDKPVPKLTAGAKKETKKIEFGTRFDKAHRRQKLTKLKTIIS
jgi:hypothetical protein